MEKPLIKVPPVVKRNKTLFVPLEFWLETIEYLDKRVEIVALGSGYGVIEMNVKLQRGKICEVEFQEKIRVRELVSKAGNRAIPQTNGFSDKENI